MRDIILSEGKYLVGREKDPEWRYIATLHTAAFIYKGLLLMAVNTPKLDIGGACHGINNRVMCVFYLSGERQSTRERCRRKKLFTRPRAVDWIIQINIDIKARELCGRRRRAQVTPPKRYYIRERRVLMLLGGCERARQTMERVADEQTLERDEKILLPREKLIAPN